MDNSDLDVAEWKVVEVVGAVDGVDVVDVFDVFSISKFVFVFDTALANFIEFEFINFYSLIWDGILHFLFVRHLQRKTKVLFIDNLQ